MWSVRQHAIATDNDKAVLMKTIDLETLSTVTGGMRWEDFRPSTNVEDRRSPAAKKRDQQWWDRTHAVPLPPRRPPGL